MPPRRPKPSSAGQVAAGRREARDDEAEAGEDPAGGRDDARAELVLQPPGRDHHQGEAGDRDGVRAAWPRSSSAAAAALDGLDELFREDAPGVEHAEGEVEARPGENDDPSAA